MTLTNTELLDRYRTYWRRRAYSPGTRRHYNTILANFRQHIAPTRLVDASPDDIESWLDTHRLGSRARYTYVSVLAGMYRWAVIEGIANVDPTVKVVRPKLPRSVPRPMSEPELRRAMAAADPRIRAWLALMAYGGLRCQEVAGLRREDVMLDRDPPVLLVAAGKGGRQRIVPVAPVVEEALRGYGLPALGPMFIRWDRPRQRLPLSAAAVSERVGVFLRDQGIAATAHQGRHLFGTKLYAATNDLRAVQEAMGHASPTTTAMYVAYSTSTVSDAIQRFGAQQVQAPFTDAQVEAINRYQQSGETHPFTCRHRLETPHSDYGDHDFGILVATSNGLRCRDCGYTQDWVWDFMAGRAAP